jgi:hypothetical protein
MGSGFVIKVKIPGHTFVQLNRVIMDVQVYMLVSYAAPEAFNKDIIDRSSLSIHTGLYVMRLQQAGELSASELHDENYFQTIFNVHNQSERVAMNIKLIFVLMITPIAPV